MILIPSVVPFSVGDAVCTISAATCFPEPFINEGKRLGYVHRNFSGTRYSDHVALLSVFQAWDDARYVVWHSRWWEVTGNTEWAFPFLGQASNLLCFSEWVVKKQRKDFVNTKDSAWPLLEWLGKQKSSWKTYLLVLAFLKVILIKFSNLMTAFFILRW